MAAGNSAPSAAARALAYAEAEATRRRVLEAEHTLGRVPREAVDMRDEEQSDDEVAAGLGQEPPSPGPWDGDERDRAPLPVLGSREQPFELEAPQEPAPSPSPAPRAAAAAAPAPRPAPKRWSPLLEGCRNVHRYKRLNTIDEGTFGVVHRAQDRETGRIVALKRLKTERRSNQFPITSLREINILLSLRHENVVELIEMVTDPETDDVFMVMEFMEHDMKMLLRQKQLSGSLFPQAQVKTLMQQLLAGVHALHSNWVLHRDLKTSNLLLNDKGVLKLADFGLARKYTLPCGQYTQPVVTLWYRAPELLLGAKQYGPEVDMWSVGCIMAELLSCEPLFPGKGEFDQISTIFATLGTPTKETWPGIAQLPVARAYTLPKFAPGKLRQKFPTHSFTGAFLSEAGMDLLTSLLAFDPKRRLTAAAALEHAWFREAPRPTAPQWIPTMPSLNEDARRRQRVKDASPHDSLRLRRERDGDGDGDGDGDRDGPVH